MKSHLQAGRVIVALAAGLVLILAAPAPAGKPIITPPFTTFCGNGVVETNKGEQCDASNLNGKTCESQGFPEGGTLACDASCQFDTSGCFVCGDGIAEGPEQCDQGDLAGETCASQGFVGGTLSCGGGCVFDTGGCSAVRFVDNGDGTITDFQTGLEWEKKTDNGSVHDKDDVYQWSSSGTAPDGGAFTTFLATLNNCTSGDGSAVSGGFAGHCDWRLAQIDELRTILNESCSTPPCVDPVFNTDCTSGCTATTCSCTASSDYWSASTVAGSPVSAWRVFFFGGSVGFAVIRSS